MARIRDASVEDVKVRADLVEVVSARTRLRKSGARFVGRCPFHEERTPSFSVSPDRGFYHCFGCGVSGDAITFVRETEGLDFAGAVEALAERFGVSLEYEEATPEVDAARRRRERLLALLESAAVFYERRLWESAAGRAARDYLGTRGLGEPVCREYRLGLGAGGATLAGKAAERGYSREELAAAGLVSPRGSDYFGQRLLFPLMDARGRVLGFQARKLRDDDPLRAKYVNSPESDLFRKGSLLYGLDRARTAIAKADWACVVEGNTDVLALRQAGIEPVVASMGTALTERQLRELSRLTRRLTLCFDGDAAGEAATLRGMELAASQRFEVKVVPLPPGIDPADTAADFGSLLERAESYVSYRVRLEIERAADRQEAFVRVRETLSSVEDSPEREDALRFAADRLDLPREMQGGLVTRAKARVGTVSSKVLAAGERLERMFLAAALLDPEAAAEYLGELRDEHFDRPEHRALRARLAGDATAGRDEALEAELWATAITEGIDAGSARGLFLELERRYLDRQIAALRVSDLTREGERRLVELVQLQNRLREALETLA